VVPRGGIEPPTP